MGTSNSTPTLPAAAPMSLEQELASRRDAGQAHHARRLFWRDLFTSLWAPITLLGIAFIPYLFVIGFWPEAGGVGQRVMQGLALLLFLYFLGLLGHRLAFPGRREQRKLRHEAGELNSEIAEILQRAGDKIDPKTRGQIVAQAAAVDQARIGGSRELLEKELEKLATLTEKHLGAWRKNSTWDLIWGLAKALLIALAIRAVLIEPFRIPTGSMIPTMLVGDQIFVNKFIYGVRIPWLNRVPFVIVREPERGDVVVFENPLDPSKDYVKRVIGVPGDVVELKHQRVYVNGVEQPREEVGQYPQWALGPEGRWYSQPSTLYREILSGHPHPVLQIDPPQFARDEGPYVVPSGHVFVMGDNRDNSSDSRSGFGIEGHHGRTTFVPYGNIKGKAMVIWFSWSQDGVLSGLPFWPFDGSGLRTDRLFRPVQ